MTRRSESGKGPHKKQTRSGAPNRPGGPAARPSGSAGRPGGKPQGGAKRRKATRGLGGDQVEGRQAVRELLLAGRRPVREVLMIQDMDKAGILEDITALAQETKVSFHTMTRKKFEAEALTMSHQGVLARAKELEPVGLDQLSSQRAAFLLMLDGITDPHNVGAILRTAECAGVTGVVMPRYRAAHITPTVTKTAAGAVEHLQMAVVGGIPTAVTDLKKAGVLTIGLDMAGDVNVFELPVEPEQKIALVLGAEAGGLARLVRQRVDILASIPLSGGLNSLNVAAAASIACFEIVRRRALTA